MILKVLRVREGARGAAASAGLDPGGTFLEGIMVGSSTDFASLRECGRIETPAGQHRPHSILSVLRFEGSNAGRFHHL